MIKQIGQPGWVVEKQPANHCLKPCGLPIDSGVSTPWTTPRAIAPAADQVLLLIRQDGLQTLESLGLSIGANNRHHSLMQGISLAR